MLTKTHKYFNQLTRQALIDKVDGYVSKSKSLSFEIARLKSKLGLEKIYRFDLGENVDGFSPMINNYLECLQSSNQFMETLNAYPDITHRLFREKLAALHNISREEIVVSAGLDSILDLISRCFFDHKDMFLVPVPDFFLFENYSERMGAIPLFLPLPEENQFEWDEQVLIQFEEQIKRFRPKLVWMSNPNNPSGKLVTADILHRLIEITNQHNVFIVVDEAYAEYIPGNQHSAAPFISQYKNLMVLRTFSKAYGLAGIRLGYLMSSSTDIINALLMHRQYFPVTKMAINLASIAIKDQSFIAETIAGIQKRKSSLFGQLNLLETFAYVPSDTNIFMLKNHYLPNNSLKALFKKFGIFTSLVGGCNDKNGYLRITIKNDTDNEYFYRVCLTIEKELRQSIKIKNHDFSLS
jgi:histidinol-phosphate aminotransferase